MRRAVTLEEIARIRASIEKIGGLSDNVVKMGRFGLGLDGLLAWVPAIGTLYSLGAAGFLLVQGWRARVPNATLAKSLALLGARSALTLFGESLPIFLPVELIVDFFRAHKWTADLMLKAIDDTRYVEGAVSLAPTGAAPDGRRVVQLS